MKARISDLETSNLRKRPHATLIRLSKRAWLTLMILLSSALQSKAQLHISAFLLAYDRMKGGCNLLMEILLCTLYSKDIALQANPGSWQQQLLLQSQGPGPE